MKEWYEDVVEWEGKKGEREREREGSKEEKEWNEEGN